MVARKLVYKISLTRPTYSLSLPDRDLAGDLDRDLGDPDLDLVGERDPERDLGEPDRDLTGDRDTDLDLAGDRDPDLDLAGDRDPDRDLAGDRDPDFDLGDPDLDLAGERDLDRDPDLDLERAGDLEPDFDLDLDLGDPDLDLGEPDLERAGDLEAERLPAERDLLLDLDLEADPLFLDPLRLRDLEPERDLDLEDDLEPDLDLERDLEALRDLDLDLDLDLSEPDSDMTLRRLLFPVLPRSLSDPLAILSRSSSESSEESEMVALETIRPFCLAERPSSDFLRPFPPFRPLERPPSSSSSLWAPPLPFLERFRLH